MSKENDELPKLPPLEEVLKAARGSASSSPGRLPLNELLRQLGDYIPHADLKKLIEGNISEETEATRIEDIKRAIRELKEGETRLNNNYMSRDSYDDIPF